MNPNTGEFEQLPDDVIKQVEQIEHLEAQYDKRILEIDPLAEKPKDLDLRYEVGEVISIKGWSFEISDIGKDRLILKPRSLVSGIGTKTPDP